MLTSLNWPLTSKT